MVNTLKLKGLMAEKDISSQKLASYLGMHRSTFLRKLRAGSSFTVKDAEIIARKLELTEEEIMAVFFGRKSQKT